MASVNFLAGPNGPSYTYPFKPRDVLVLMIKKDIVQRSSGDVRLGSTTLYRLLGRLLDEGLIEESASRPVAHLDDERRRYYRITGAGRRALAAELKRLDRLVLAVRRAR